MKTTILLIVLFAFSFSACEKEQNRRMLNAYMSFKVDGKDVKITDGAGVNENVFDCVLRGDTALYIDVAKRYLGLGFVIKADVLRDGTYTLDNQNTGYYTDPNEYRRYTTNSVSTGTITLRKNTFKASSMLNTLEGEFSFKGEDTLTHKTFEITNGSFLMERNEE